MVKVGQIGVGRWGRNLLRNFAGLKDCVLKICCDKNTETLEKIKLDYAGKINTTKSFDDLINDKELDAVVVTTLPATHHEFAIKALSKGKHVFVEKPLALKVEDAQEMVDLAEKKKKILMVGHLLLYHPAVKKIKEYIQSGDLGQIQYMYTIRVNLGQVREEENVLWSLTAHDISVAMYLLEKKPNKVTAFGKSYIRENIQDVVFVDIDFDHNIIAHIHASWLDPHKMRKFTIVGSKKMVVFDDMESTEKVRIYDKGFDWEKNTGTYDSFLTLREGDIYIPKINMIEPLRLECQHFIDCIRGEKKPFTDGRNGLEVLKVLAAAEKSLQRGGTSVKV